MNNHRNRRRAQQRHDAECSVLYAFFVLPRWGKCLCDKKNKKFAFTQLHPSHFFSTVHKSNACFCRCVFLSVHCAPPPLPPSVCFLLSSSLHPRLRVMSQGAARGLIYLHQYLASFPFLMGDTEAWRQTEMGAVGRGVGGRLDRARERKRDAIKRQTG